MDLGDVVAAIAVAFVTAWVTTSFKVRRLRKAERHDDALRAVEDAMAPYHRVLLTFQRGYVAAYAASEPKRTELDFDVVRTIVNVRTDLYLWRRYLIERRANRMFGELIFDVAMMEPEDADYTSMLGLMNVDQHLAQDIEEPSPSMLWMTEQPPGERVERFLGQVERLSRGR